MDDTFLYAVLWSFPAVWILFAVVALLKFKASKTIAIGGGFIAAGLFPAVIGAVLGSGPGSQAPTEVQSPQEIRQAQIEKAFSAWDGSHMKLEELIKPTLHDPDSYKHIKSSYWDMGDHTVVLTRYSGTNAFGARVQGWVKAKASLKGDVLEIVDDG